MGWLASRGLGALALISLGMLISPLAPLAGWAGSSTAESVWDRRNARARALEQVPRGAVITRERCLEIGMRGNEERYRCTVWYSMPASDEPAPRPAQP